MNANRETNRVYGWPAVVGYLTLLGLIAGAVWIAYHVLTTPWFTW